MPPCFGIDRKWIVRRVLLGGASIPASKSVSGPFPAGTSINDPIVTATARRSCRALSNRDLLRSSRPVHGPDVQNPRRESSRGRDTSQIPSGAKRPASTADIALPELTLAHPATRSPASLPDNSRNATSPRRYPDQADRVHRRQLNNRQSRVQISLCRTRGLGADRRCLGHSRPQWHRQRAGKRVLGLRLTRSEYRHELERRSVTPCGRP